MDEIREAEVEKPAASKEKSASPVPLIIAAILLPVSLFLLFVAATTYGDGLAALSFKPVTGKVEELVVEYGPLTTSKHAVVSFELNGRRLKGRSSLPGQRVIKQGETLEVYACPSGSGRVVIEQAVDYDTVIVYGAFGLGLLTVFFLILNGRYGFIGKPGSGPGS